MEMMKHIRRFIAVCILFSFSTARAADVPLEAKEAFAFTGHDGSGHLRWATRAIVVPGGKQIVSAGLNTIRVWEVGKTDPVKELDTNSEYWAMDISKNGELLVAAGVRVCKVWNLKTGKLVREFESLEMQNWGVAFLPTDDHIITGGNDRMLRVWNYSTGKQVRKIALPEKVRVLALAPNRKRVALGLFSNLQNQFGAVEIIDLATENAMKQYEDFEGQVASAAYSKDGTQLLTGSFDGHARLWSVKTGKLVRAFKTGDWQVESAIFLRDESLVITAAGGKQGIIEIWNTSTGDQKWQSEKLPYGVIDLCAMPDGKSFVATGKDGSVRMWVLSGATAAKVAVKTGKANAAVEKQLKEMVVPSIVFDEVPLPKAVDFLEAQAKSLDKTGKGIAITLDLPKGFKQHPMTLRLKKIPMTEALRYVTELSGTAFRVENGVVVIGPEKKKPAAR